MLYFVQLLSLLIVGIMSMGSAGGKEMQFEEILDGLKSKSLVYLDVRNRDELQSDGKVVGSVVVPLPELDEAFKKSAEDFEIQYGFPKPAQDATNIVVACRSGRRAVTAIDILEKLGYNSLKIYKGSFLEWQAKGGPISKE